MRSRPFFPARLAALAIAATGCRAIECPPPEPSHSVMAWQTTAGARGEIAGVVLSILDGRPLGAARVRTSPGDSSWRRVTAEGRFRLKRPAGSASVLEVTAPRYVGASLALGLRSDSALAVVASLARPRKATTNAACGRTSQAPLDTIE